MQATQPHPTHHRLDRVLATALIGLVAIQTLGCTTQQPTHPRALPAASCCEVSASNASAVAPSPPVVATSSGEDRGIAPDAIADEVGGIAARLHSADGTPIPGDVFVLMATAGSDATARLYDQTPYTHDNGTAADAHDSNLAAATTVETITGIDVEVVELTNAAGGGPSGGVAYTIAYLNIISNGAFTGDVRVAATGRIGTHGYIDPINAIDEKTAAAHFADADVLFTPSTPTDHHLDSYGARDVGERFRTRHTGNPLADERLLDHYHAWGADQPDGMNIVYVRHIADVAAYLCGVGSPYACDVTELLEDTTTEFTPNPAQADQLSLDHEPASVR